jgi:hypothetical protein
MMQISLDYATCPWDQESVLVYISIFAQQILSILTVICSTTLINAVFYLIALGWSTTFFNIDRNQVTNVMFVGGSIYLLQLAKNYSDYQQSLFPVIFGLVLFLEYSYLLYINLKSTIKQIRKLN